MLSKNDVTDLLDRNLTQAMGPAMITVKPGSYDKFYTTIPHALQDFQTEALHAAGSFQETGRGAGHPQVDAFTGAKVTITAVGLGQKRGFEWRTVKEAEAAGVGAIITQQAQVWAGASETTKDKQAAEYVRDNTPAGYDGVVLFSASHRQRSRFTDGLTLSNINDTAAAIDPTSAKAAHMQFADTMAYAENGERIENRPTHAVATRITDWHELKAVFESERIAGVANNDINTLKNIVQVDIWERLVQTSGSQYWYMVKAKSGLIMIEKEGLTTQAWYDPDSRVNYISADQQHKPGYNDWRGVFRQKIA